MSPSPQLQTNSRCRAHRTLTLQFNSARLPRGRAQARATACVAQMEHWIANKWEVNGCSGSTKTPLNASCVFSILLCFTLASVTLAACGNSNAEVLFCLLYNLATRSISLSMLGPNMALRAMATHWRVSSPPLDFFTNLGGVPLLLPLLLVTPMWLLLLVACCRRLKNFNITKLLG